MADMSTEQILNHEGVNYLVVSLGGSGWSRGCGSIIEAIDGAQKGRRYQADIGRGISRMIELPQRNAVNNASMRLMVCPKCNIGLSSFDERGMHNFCPTSTAGGQIVNICMKCKMEEIRKRWSSS